ncbi:MAG: OsmC family protein [Draconibacterium sp.]|nr:OsmC family protein [Draconibacterium sp.]
MDMTISFPGGKKVNADFGGFTHKTDQGISGGGEGTAPEPFALFLASIGTCAGIYVLGFCQQRGIDTEGMEIKQKMSFDPFTRLINKIKLDIILPEGFPKKYKKAVINSASLCAVKKHLENPPQFEITTN